MNRIARISLSALALLAAFTLGMIFAQRLLTPARAAGNDDPVVAAFPIVTEQTTQGNTTTTEVTKIMQVRASGGRRTYARYEF